MLITKVLQMKLELLDRFMQMDRLKPEQLVM